MKVKLSVVIITFNEERNIARCIDSVKDIADDIVVVDSFSKDKTKEICLEKGVRFVEHAFEGHIQQKNWAITQAKYPHVLSLDADEAPDEKLQQSILAVKENFTADGYSMNRLTNYCGTWIHHCGWYPDVKLRLWDSRKGKWGGLNPHDIYEMEDGCTIEHLKGDLLHYSYYTREDHLKQIEKFTEILGQSMFEAGRKTNPVANVFKAIFKFIRDYFLTAGILDGRAGFTISWLSAGATYKKYKNLWRLQKAAKKK
ncbi:MAG: glycosyltransferase family 2 protein [Bacteroidales bacterium]|nr:glycosyltransferase family 2 protein [Bacteroidales bacterium]